MSGSSQQGIPYADRPLATTLSGTGVYASTEFQQYLERLSAMVGTIPSGQTSIQGEIDSINSSITSIHTTLDQLYQTDVAQNTRLVNLENSTPVIWLGSGTSHLAASTRADSGAITSVIAEDVLAGRWLLVGSVSFTGNGILAWGRSSIGTAPGLIETDVGQFGTVFCGFSPAELGFDVTTTTIVWHYVNNVHGMIYLNAQASFSGGTIDAYGSLIAVPA